MKIEMLAVASLNAYSRNSRTHSAEQIDQIARSIQEFGFTNPVLVDEKNEIVAGHGRVAGAQHLGLDKVPCIRLTHLTDEQKRAYVIADNKIALNSGWDEELLKAEFADLGNSEVLGAMGFSEIELGDLLSESISLSFDAAPESVQDNLAEIESIKAQRKKGNKQTAEKGDTEHFLVVVFDNREGREEALKKLGLPVDERYVHHRAVTIAPRFGAGAAKIESERKIQASSTKHSGRGG